MAVSSYLRASVCLTILIFLSTSTSADVISACQNACSGSEGQTAFVECTFKCKEILSYYLSQLDNSDEIPSSESEEEYEDPTGVGLLGSEEVVRLGVSRPLPFLSRSDRGVRRANLLLNRFVRYGRSQTENSQKTSQRRPKYLRVGRSDELSEADFQDEAAKRASRFVRIGKSGIFDVGSVGPQGAGFREGQFEVDKKNNKRPSKYVRIGKRGDKVAPESGRQASKYVRIGKRGDELGLESGRQTA